MTARYWNETLETKPWRDVERWHAEQVSACLPALRARSGMYRDLHAGLPSAPRYRELAELSQLPFTTKDNLRAAQEAASDEQPFGRNQAAPVTEIVQTLSSSGTTGTPMVYALTRDDVEIFTDAIAHTWFTAGVRPGDIVAHLVGLPMVAGGLSYADGFRRVGAALVWLGGFPTERILREMRRLRCTTLLATTSFGLHLAGQWDAVGEETGIPSRLAKVLCGGEPGLGQPEIRRRIERALGITHLRETMGLGDVISGMWAECEAQDGMHFNAQRYVAIELVEPESGAALPWREGTSGELVYSAFARQASPVLRYRSRDHAVVVGTSCACGRTSPRIRCIGRTDDMLIYKGMNVFPSALRDVIATRFADRVEPLVRVWKERKDQVRFDEPIAVDVEAAPGFELSRAETLRKEIEDAVRTQLQVRIRITVLAHGTLPRSAYKNALLAVRDGT